MFGGTQSSSFKQDSVRPSMDCVRVRSSNKPTAQAFPCGYVFPGLLFQDFLDASSPKKPDKRVSMKITVQMEAQDLQYCPTILAFGWAATVSTLVDIFLASSGDQERPASETSVYTEVAPKKNNRSHLLKMFVAAISEADAPCPFLPCKFQSGVR